MLPVSLPRTRSSRDKPISLKHRQINRYWQSNNDPKQCEDHLHPNWKKSPDCFVDHLQTGRGSIMNHEYESVFMRPVEHEYSRVLYPEFTLAIHNYSSARMSRRHVRLAAAVSFHRLLNNSEIASDSGYGERGGKTEARPLLLKPPSVIALAGTYRLTSHNSKCFDSFNRLNKKPSPWSRVDLNPSNIVNQSQLVFDRDNRDQFWIGEPYLNRCLIYQGFYSIPWGSHVPKRTSAAKGLIAHLRG